MAFVGSGLKRNQDVGFWEIASQATPGNVIRDDLTFLLPVPLLPLLH